MRFIPLLSLTVCLISLGLALLLWIIAVWVGPPIGDALGGTGGLLMIPFVIFGITFLISNFMEE